MIGKIIGAVAGSQAAKHVRGIDGPGGALLGMAAPALLRRLGPATLIAAAAGGYAYKTYKDRKEAERLRASAARRPSEPTRTQA